MATASRFQRIDGRYRQGQVRQLFFLKTHFDLVIHLVRHVSLMQIRYRFRPGKAARSRSV